MTFQITFPAARVLYAAPSTLQSVERIAKQHGACFFQISATGEVIHPSPYHPGTWTCPIYTVGRDGTASRLS